MVRLRTGRGGVRPGNATVGKSNGTAKSLHVNMNQGKKIQQIPQHDAYTCTYRHMNDKKHITDDKNSILEDTDQNATDNATDVATVTTATTTITAHIS